MQQQLYDQLGTLVPTLAIEDGLFSARNARRVQTAVEGGGKPRPDVDVPCFTCAADFASGKAIDASFRNASVAMQLLSKEQ
jgi:hypothetical protein